MTQRQMLSNSNSDFENLVRRVAAIERLLATQQTIVVTDPTHATGDPLNNYATTVLGDLQSVTGIAKFGIAYYQGGVWVVQARSVAGEVGATGAITDGTGFTVVYNGTGDYSVTFDVPFDLTPKVVVSAGATSVSGWAKLNPATIPSPTGFRVHMRDADIAGAPPTDCIFDFIATDR